MNEQLQTQHQNVEQLIPRVGVEHQLIGEGHSDTFAHIPLDSEPLFEQNGVKALAQIKIAHQPEGPVDTYYVVDVSGNGYTRKNESGVTENIDHLVVSSDYFSNPHAAKDQGKFASLRKGGKFGEGPRTVVGGHYHNTRFDKKDSKNTFGVSIMDSEYSPSLLIGPSEYGGQGMEVSFKRSVTDPADTIKTHREQKAQGEVPSDAEHDEKGKTIRSRFVNAVKRNFTKSKNADFHYGDDEMQFDSSRGHYKEVYDDVNLHDLEVLDDKFGLKPENAEQVKSALKLVEDQERKEVVTAVTEVIRKKRLQKGLGWAAAMAAQGAAMYFDHKTGGIISEGKDSSASDLTAAVELVTMGGAGYAAAMLGMKAEKIHRILRQGVDKMLPATTVKELKADVSEPDFIRDVAKQHEKFLYDLDKSVHELRKQYEN